jgi:hypothetical protein
MKSILHLGFISGIISNIKHLWERLGKAWQYSIIVFVTVKVVLSIAGLIVLNAFQPTHDALPHNNFIESQDSAKIQISKQPLLNMWFSWDSFIYRKLETTPYLTSYQIVTNAKDKAHSATDGAPERFAFAPLYPLVSKLVGKLMGNRYSMALIVTSNIAFLVALYYMYRLSKHLFASDEAAEKCTKYLALLPAAFIFQAAMSESLFICLVISCFYYAETKRWGISGILGFFAALTRSTGFIIALPLVLILLEQSSFRLNIKSLLEYLRNGWYILLIPLGWLSFMIYCKIFTGDLMAYSTIQHLGWGVTFQNPLVTLWYGIQQAPYVSTRAWFASSYLLTGLLSLKALRMPYSVYSLIFILLLLSLGPVNSFTSIIRHTVVIFPLALLLTRFSSNWPRLDSILTVSLAILQGVLFAVWLNYYTTFII